MSKEKETFSIAEETKLGFNIFNISVLVHAKRVEKKQSKAGKKLVGVVQCLHYTLFVNSLYCMRRTLFCGISSISQSSKTYCNKYKAVSPSLNKYIRLNCIQKLMSKEH